MPHAGRLRQENYTRGGIAGDAVLLSRELNSASTHRVTTVKVIRRRDNTASDTLPGCSSGSAYIIRPSESGL